MQLIKLLKLLKLKLLFILLFLGLQSYAQKSSDVLKQNISIEAKDENLTSILKEIEDKTNVKFMYNPNDLIGQQVVNISHNKVNLSKLLQELFDESSLSYKVKGEQIILHKPIVSKNKSFDNSRKNKNDNIVLSGYIFDAESGEAMIAAYIYDKETLAATTTNNFGFFSLTLPSGTHNIVLSFLGYETQELKVNKTKQVKIELKVNSNALEEVVIIAKEEKEEDAVQSTQMGRTRISANRLKSIPSVAGEQDVLKAITLLPGIKQGVDGNAGFYVRGGGPDQNLILMDGVPMYNPYHLWGFLSTFNPDAINNIEITKGAFPARYGGRLSSVLDITTKDGNNQKWEKRISLGLLSARASISGPIKKDQSSIFISARRTLLDLILVPILAERQKGYKGKQAYNFGDVNLKFNHKFSAKDRIYLSGFYSRDAFKFTEKEKDKFVGTQKLVDNQGWQNGYGSLRWNHLFNDKLFLNTTAYYSNYQYFSNKTKEVKSLNNTIIPSSLKESEYSSNIDDWAIKQDYHWFLNDRHNIRFGGSAIFHTFKPGVNSSFQKTGETTVVAKSPDLTTKAIEYAIYLEDEMALGKKIKINIGVHSSAFSVQDTNYFSIQPRLSFRYLLNKNTSIKLGYAQMSQNLHLLTSGSLTKSSDLWVPVTKKITPPNSTQYSIGTAFNIGKNYGIEIEGYYKEMKNLIEYKDGANFLITTEGWEEKIESGDGESFGIEIFLQKKKGKLTGWLGYTLSKTTRAFDNINFGKAYPYKYDRRHDISVVANYQLNPKWSFNATWVFFTGNHVTYPTAIHINPDYQGDENFGWWKFLDPTSLSGTLYGSNPGINQNSPERNNFQLPTYHRLDLTATRKWLTKKGRKAELIFGLTNAYNKFNPSFFDQSFSIVKDSNGQRVITEFYQYTIFPIMPTLNYSLAF